jgi:tetratricopeptide (TPR) repeat protein
VLLAFMLASITSVVGAVPRPVGLSAAATASDRPPECAPLSGVNGASVWQLARVPNLVGYCSLMATAQVRLSTDPRGARRAAEEAQARLAGRASPQVVLGRAALATGDAEGATTFFGRARALDPRSLDNPSVMRDVALALAATNRRAEARIVYETLVPRIQLLADNELRVAVLLDAALVVMADEAAKPRPSLAEAIAYLREATRLPSSARASDVRLTLALALDRAGEPVRSDSALVEVSWQVAPHRPEFVAAATIEDRLALSALAEERTSRPRAIRLWQELLAGPGKTSAWAPSTRARIERLRRSPSLNEPPRAPTRRPR